MFRRVVLIVIGFLTAGSVLAGQWPKALENIPANSFQAVIVVPDAAGQSFQAQLSAWERQAGVWRAVLGAWPVVIGRNGLAPSGEKREGDGRTPSGVLPLVMAFGRETSVKTGLPYRQSLPDDFWVDDPASLQYNQWVRGTPQAASFETMLREDGLYDLGIVIGYNMDPVVPGNGSAIFMHIWREAGQKPTAGCVAMSREHLVKLLAWLKAEASPVVILGSVGK